MLIQQILFIVAFSITAIILIKRIKFIRRNILLGKKEELPGTKAERLKNLFLIAFGQKKMFKNPVPAIFHFFIYAGFIIINLEMLEIGIDGIFGTHRVFSPYMGAVYPYFISAFEILAVLVILACVIFLARRYIVKVPRFQSYELTSWRRTDATLILVIEIFLMSFFLTYNAADMQLQSRGFFGDFDTGGHFLISGLFMGLLNNVPTPQVVWIERIGWWAHILGVMMFAVYITYSKHLHIFMAFPNVYFSKVKPQGKMDNMPAITNEVKLALGLPVDEEEKETAPPDRFGAKDVQDLSWKNLMDAYSCTECGRCTANCPASITGKLLSPRKIMIDTRFRVEEIGYNMDKKGKDHDDGKSLIHDYISLEELNACTNCQACVEACPVNIDPLDIIWKLRRYQIMEEASAPQEWNLMFNNIENNFAPWQFSPDDRLKWKDD